MRWLRSLALLVALLVPAQASAAVAIVQHVIAETNDSGNTNVATVSSTGAGNLLVAGIITFRGSSTTLAVTGISGGCSGAWTQATSALGTATTGGGTRLNTDVWYCLVSTSGTTSITTTFNASTSSGKDVEIWEVSGFTTVAFDLANNANGTWASPQTGVSITTTGAVGFVVGVMQPACCTITSNPTGGNEFTSGGDIASTDSGAGAVSLISSSAAAHQPQWSSTDTPGNVYCTSTAAFKETASAATPRRSTLVGVGP